MYASRSSPPAQDINPPASTPGSIATTPASVAINNHTTSVANKDSPRSSVPPTTHGRKRKRGGQVASTSHAASPAPSEPGSTNGTAAGNDSLLASRADLYSRPMLSISRGPIFTPISEGSEWYRTEAVGVNRVGFRYMPAGINPPGFITPCRTIETAPTSFRISWEDRSPFLRVAKDGLSLAGFRGFRSARCNAPIREGRWYLEVKIINGGGDKTGEQGDSSVKKEGSHVRLGWGRREASLNGPVGLDGYSYAYRDKSGDKVTLSRPRPYGNSFKSGDVIGMYISLPPLRQPNKKDPHDPAHIHRERIPIDLKGQEHFEILEYPVSKEMTALMDYSGKPTNSASVPSANAKKAAAAGAKPPDRTSGPTEPKAKPNNPPQRPLPTLSNSRIAFFINGESQGIAFEDIYDFLPLRQTEEQKRKAKERGKRAREGVKEHRENPFDDGTLGYYPMISLFNDAVVRINPGPSFEFPPPLDIDALLEGRPQPATISPPSQATKSEENSTDTMKVDLPVKSEPEAVTLDVKMDVDSEETKPQRTWRPAIERYPEFMKEQWHLDEIEEEEAKIEFQKQMAKGEVVKTGRKQPGSRAKTAENGEAKKPKAASKKKKGAAGVETPEATPTPVPESATGPARKKAKKVAGQAALGVAGSGQPTPDTSNPRSATETPFSTPPPPSVSSTAAAAAAAAAHLHLQQQHPPNPHQFHHALARSDSNSNRPSPSPLRQSTAYRETHAERAGDNDELPGSIGQNRPKKHPGSQKGRYHAQQAIAAAAAATLLTPPIPTSGTQHGQGISNIPLPFDSEVSRSEPIVDVSKPTAKIGAHRATTGTHRPETPSEGLHNKEEEEEEEELDEFELAANAAGYESSNAGTHNYDMDDDDKEEDEGRSVVDATEVSTPGDDDRDDDPEDEDEVEDQYRDGDVKRGDMDGGDDEATTDGEDLEPDRDVEMGGNGTDDGDSPDGDIGIEIEAQTVSGNNTRSNSPA